MKREVLLVGQFGEGRAGMEQGESVIEWLLVLVLLLLLLLLTNELLVEGVDSGNHQRMRDEGLMNESIAGDRRLKRSRDWSVGLMLG
jgi:hypothetical protein